MKKVILISGGSDGLGKAIAAELSPENTVIILSPTKDKLEKTAQELICDYEVTNVADYNSCQTAITNIIKKYKQIDCLINNAALWIQGELDENDPDYIQQVLNVNTLGPIFLTKATLPTMKKQKEGLIININSQAGLYGKAERSIYTATKFALTGLTKSLQSELAKYNIRVTGIYPGKMKTDMFKKMGIEKPMDDALDPKEVATTIRFLLSLDKNTVIPGLGIKNIQN
jgi:short-subunit dehydrogenase